MPEKPRRSKRRLNTLDGKTWTRYSISIWDLTKTMEETRLRHPALFPVALVKRLLDIYTRPGDVVFDPFMGVGSTLVAAQELKRQGVGFEISSEFISLAKQRLQNCSNQEDVPAPVIYHEDARRIGRYIESDSVDLVVTSPPYWDIHCQRRTADGKQPRPYSPSEQDIGNITDYNQFLDALSSVFEQLFTVLKPSHWCILVVMDLRKGSRFYPLHMDCIQQMRETGFSLEDIIIWDRHHEYHNLRPLGFPYVFRVNKVHEYILIFKKPDS
ncbi:MAG: DNA methyltransferase [Promethearchaeota archaeon]